MKNQIVYVVTDKASDTIVGAFNDYKAAEEVAFKWQDVKDSREEEVAVTPVAVDCSVSIPACYTFEELDEALDEIIDCIKRAEFETDSDEEEEDEDECPESEIDPEFMNKIDDILDSLYDKDEDEEEEDEDDTAMYSLTPKGEFVLKLLNGGTDFDEAMKVANVIFDGE